MSEPWLFFLFPDMSLWPLGDDPGCLMVLRKEAPWPMPVLGEEPLVFARRACHLLMVGIICLRWSIEFIFIKVEGD